jgi:hypothetical protein
MDDHDDKHNNQTEHGRRMRKTAVATNKDKNNYSYGGTMIGGRRRAGICRVIRKGDATTTTATGCNNQPISDGDEGGLHRG